MTLQPPPGYGSQAATPPESAPAAASVEARLGDADVPNAQLGNPDGAWLRVISREPNPLHRDDAAPASSGDAGELGERPSDQAGAVRVETAAGVSSVSTGPATGGAASAPIEVVPARRRPAQPPLGTSVVGGSSVTLHRVVALDRLASGFGYLTVEWLVRQRGYDLLALADGAGVTARGHALTIDLTQPLGRVLIATGTQGTMPLPPTELRVSNGSTQVVVPIDGGTSLGVWPRLSISRVDEFVVIRHEHDPLSGMLDAVAGAYGYDPRNFTLTHTYLLG